MAKCERCGSTDVQWVRATGEHGQYSYLEDVKTWHGDRHNVVKAYSAGPHFKTCERRRAISREYMRDALANRIVTRYMTSVVTPLLMAQDFSRAAICAEKIADWRIAFNNR